MIYLLSWLAVVNLILFILMKTDKTNAKKRKQRIPEKTLIFLGIIGGALGGLMGMQRFRHKTNHRYFYVIYIFSVIVWIVGILFFYKTVLNLS